MKYLYLLAPVISWLLTGGLAYWLGTVDWAEVGFALFIWVFLSCIGMFIVNIAIMGWALVKSEL